MLQQQNRSKKAKIIIKIALGRNNADRIPTHKAPNNAKKYLIKNELFLLFFNSCQPSFRDKTVFYNII